MAILRLIVALSCAPLAFSLTLLAESTPGVIPIQWSTDSSAVYYEVYRATNSTFNDAELIGTNGPTSTNYLDDAAGFAVPYHYWVLAKQENGSSQPVVEAEGTQTNKLWQYNANGAVYGAPAIGPDGTIYIATGGSTIFGATTTPGKIIALDQNGTFLWDFAGPRSFLSTPAVSVAGNVYAINGDGEVYALTSTGSLKWKRRISPANSARFWRLSPTITGDNHIILPTPSAITAVDEDGAVVWSYNVLCSFPVSAVVGADGTIYSTPDSRQIYAFSRNGDFKWAFPSANSQSQLSTQLIIDGDNSLFLDFRTSGALQSIK